VPRRQVAQARYTRPHGKNARHYHPIDPPVNR
jgi:hypothetical protein